MARTKTRANDILPRSTLFSTTHQRNKTLKRRNQIIYTKPHYAQEILRVANLHRHKVKTTPA